MDWAYLEMFMATSSRTNTHCMLEPPTDAQVYMI